MSGGEEGTMTTKTTGTVRGRRGGMKMERERRMEIARGVGIETVIVIGIGMTVITSGARGGIEIAMTTRTGVGGKRSVGRGEWP